ncbi:uncharacterized protein LOC143701728 [Siphateles boraxobius]|uniref:uncharacterized protein LOC143701728 n=1 Tax=Siphateles boraxobius TaxID=180520 RepID=UPI0040640C49
MNALELQFRRFLKDWNVRRNSSIMNVIHKGLEPHAGRSLRTSTDVTRFGETVIVRSIHLLFLSANLTKGLKEVSQLLIMGNFSTHQRLFPHLDNHFLELFCDVFNGGESFSGNMSLCKDTNAVTIFDRISAPFITIHFIG